MDKSAVKNQGLSPYIKGLALALVFSTIAIFVLAFMIKFISMGDLAIKIVNQVIKVVSIFLGCLKAITESKRGFVKGMLMGLIISLFAFLLFSLFTMKFNFDATLAIDMMISMAIGGLCGAIVVNLKK